MSKKIERFLKFFQKKIDFLLKAVYSRKHVQNKRKKKGVGRIMMSKKEYYGEVFVAPYELIEKDVDKMQMEYYKTQGEEENFLGVEVVTKKYKGEQVIITSNLVTDLSDIKYTAEDLLKLLKTNKVTSIELDEILEDLKYKE